MQSVSPDRPVKNACPVVACYRNESDGKLWSCSEGLPSHGCFIASALRFRSFVLLRIFPVRSVFRSFGVVLRPDASIVAHLNIRVSR